MKYIGEDEEKAEIYKMVADNCYKAVLLLLLLYIIII